MKEHGSRQGESGRRVIQLGRPRQWRNFVPFFCSLLFSPPSFSSYLWIFCLRVPGVEGRRTKTEMAVGGGQKMLRLWDKLLCLQLGEYWHPGHQE